LMRANASNMLYGSVNAGEVVTQLNNRHINIDKSMVQLEEPIKSLGKYEVAIRLTEGIDATLKLEILDEHGEMPFLKEKEEEDQAEIDASITKEEESIDTPDETTEEKNDASDDTTEEVPEDNA